MLLALPCISALLLLALLLLVRLQLLRYVLHTAAGERLHNLVAA